MKINWIVRLNNKVTVTSAVTILIGIAAGVVNFGNLMGWWAVKFDSGKATTYALNVVNLLFTFGGALVGVIHDPTTAGIGDSSLALGYKKPYQDK